MSSTFLQQLIDRTGQLYSLPAVAMEVLELTNQPQVDAQRLKACLENDPALTAKLLKVVNSSLFGLKRKVTDLSQAIGLLGVKPLKMLVLGFSLPKELYNAVETQALSRYWRHSLIKAVACRELAEKHWKIPGDEPFIAGLLQDIGQLMLLQHLGDVYLKFVDQAYLDPRPLAQLELDTLGFDHAIVSGRLLEKWGLASSLVQAIAVPFDTAMIDNLPEQDRVLPQILHLAELIAVILTRRPEGWLNELLAVGAKYRQLTYEQLRAVIATMEEKVVILGEVLALYQPDGPPFCDILTQAHLQLSAVAEGIMGELRANSPENLLLAETQRMSLELRSTIQSGIPVARPVTVSVSSGGSAPREAEIPDSRWLRDLAQAIETGRQQREPVTLVLVQVDHFSQLVFTQGIERATQLLKLLEHVITTFAGNRGSCTLVGEARFALIWDGCDRREGNEFAKQVVRGVREWGQQRVEGRTAAFSLSAGLATVTLPTRNFPSRELITAAERCLSAAVGSGGDCVKSIEL